MTEDGRLVDEDGNIVDVEEIINMPGGIKPGPPDPSLLPPPAGQDPAADPAEEEGSAEPAGDGRRRRGDREDRR